MIAKIKIDDVDRSYASNTESGVSAEVTATVSYEIDFAEIGEIVAKSNSAQQAQFFDSFAKHLSAECGREISFQWGALAEGLGSDARYVLLGLLEYLETESTAV